MHMSDALLSPAVGGAMWAAGAAALGIAARNTAKAAGVAPNSGGLPPDPAGAAANHAGANNTALMGIMAAFVFAGQMVNFTIPGTGSSGHIGGGVLLAALVGPWPALVALASVLLVQCLFFADGGLLAYGCNVFNMGVCSAVAAYSLVFRPVFRRAPGPRAITLASVAAVVAGLQAGAFCVVLETRLSGVTELPFGVFALLMQPVHLAIGLVEGLVTAAVLCFVWNERPELLRAAAGIPQDAVPAAAKPGARGKILAVFAVLTLAVAGGLSLFASSKPDGLEWSIGKTLARAAGTDEIEREGPVYAGASRVVEATAFMPDYGFKENESAAGTSAAGIAGSALTVALSGGAGLLIYALRKKNRASARPGSAA